jgi:hypothetical protein
MSLGCVGFGPNDLMPDVVRSSTAKEIGNIVHDILSMDTESLLGGTVGSSPASTGRESLSGVSNNVLSASRVAKTVCGLQGHTLVCCIEDR